MARIKYVDKKDLSAANQDLLEPNYNAFRALANSPDCCRAFWGLGGFFQKRSKLDSRLRELALLQVGWLARCDYEWFHHVKVSLAVGVTEADIRVIGDSEKSDSLDPVARTVLKATREMYAGPGISAETISELKGYLNAEALVDLVVVIGFYIGIVRMFGSLDLDLEPQYQEYQERFPLPHP